MALSVPHADVSLRLSIPERNSGVGIGAVGEVTHNHVLEYIRRFQGGTGAGKVGVVFSGRFSISASEDHDLRGGCASVVSGAAQNFPVVVGIFVVNRSTTSGQYLTVGAGSNPLSTWVAASGDGVIVGPDGFKAIWSPIDGYVSTAATADILRVTPATGTIAYDLVVVGRAS